MNDRLRRLARLSASTVALLGLLAALASPGRAQAADAGNVDAAILDVLKARGLIDQAQYDELLEMARARANEARGEVDLIEGRLSRLRAPDVQTIGGEPGKLVFKSADGKWSLGLHGYLQARVEVFDSQNDTQDDTNFSVPRARIAVEGNAGAANVRYKLEVDLPTNVNDQNPAQAGTVNVRDAYVDWGFPKSDIFGDTGLRMGQFKFPFGREILLPTTSTTFADTSIATNQFAPSYEPGAMLHGSAAEGEFEYFAAMANGEGRGKNNTPGDTMNGLRDGVRAVWNPLGAYKPDGAAFPTVDDGSTKVSLGASWMINHDSTGLATVTPDANTKTLGLDGQILLGPWSLLAESFQRVASQPGVADVDDSGHTVQVGWFVVPTTWELVARTSSISFDTADNQREDIVGVNWYIDRHNGKWMLDFSNLRNGGTTPDARRTQLQYQVVF